MLRKQIYFTEELDREVKFRALKQKKTEAEVIRNLLYDGLKKDKGLKRDQVKKEFENAGDFLLSLATLNVKGPKDLSENLDDYLYGAKSLKFGHLYRKRK